MSLVNDSVRTTQINMPLFDHCLSTALATQTGAPVLPGAKNRVTGGADTQSFLLESIITGEAANNVVWVINDSANSVQIFPAVGEKQNGTTNAALSIAAGRTGVFVMSKNPNPDWRSAVIT